MESLLLCDEKWLMSPNADATKFNSDSASNNNIAGCCYTTKEDCDEFFQICVNNEIICVHEPGYLDRLKSDHGSINYMRYKAILCLIQSRSHLNLSTETLSKAANYFDRFISVLDQSNGWKWWVIELVLVACLSIASKFVETAPCSLHDIQIQGLDHSFEPGLIQRMELTVLKALDWRLICTTPFSYVELMTWNIIDLLLKPHLVDHLMDQLNDLLLYTLLDCDFLAFRPSVVAVSALKCVIEELIPSTTFEAHLSYFSNLIPYHQKENMSKCVKVMKERSKYKSRASMYKYNPPSSPVTVLRMETRVNISEGKLDFSLFNPNKKRRINQQQ